MGDIIKVRFAPSPTGHLHVGGARTALFNFLFVKKARLEGKQAFFFLRFDDTDLERSKPEYVESIQRDLRWLGIEWDGVPVFQSSRFEIYKKIAYRLLEEGKAYYCFHTPQELEQIRRERKQRGLPPRYDGRCRNLSKAQIERLLKERRPAIRLAVEPGDISFNDLIRGSVSFRGEEIEDFVILRSDGTPTYNLATVVDDSEAGITHILRGEEHLPNTPKQILLYKALGKSPPLFGHLPVILGKDGKKLSKRHGASSVSEMRELGILPQALVNFLALLGWSHPAGKEVLTFEELIESFSLQRVSKSPAVFTMEKLLWLNHEHIQRMSNDQIVKLAFGEKVPSFDKTELIIEDLKKASHTVLELSERASIYTEWKPHEEVKQFLLAPEAVKIAQCLLKKLEVGLASMECVKKCMEELELPKKRFFPILRAILTGRRQGPELALIVEATGSRWLIQRLKEFLANRDKL